MVSALCWCGGLLISALGIYTHQIWLMWLGSGVIGGIGLGLGYISPVSTLIKWFPDKRLDCIGGGLDDWRRDFFVATKYRLRAAGNRVPIIMLTAKGDELSRIKGLELGADAAHDLETA